MFLKIWTHQTYTFKLLIQPPSEKIWWFWLFNRIKIKNVLLLKSQSRCFIPKSGPGLDYGQCLLFLAQWIFQKHNEMKNYKLGIKRSLTFLGLHLDFSLDNSSNLSRVYTIFKNLERRERERKTAYHDCFLLSWFVKLIPTPGCFDQTELRPSTVGSWMMPTKEFFNPSQSSQGGKFKLSSSIKICPIIFQIYG